jgi:hypothetical protein
MCGSGFAYGAFSATHVTAPPPNDLAKTFSQAERGGLCFEMLKVAVRRSISRSQTARAKPTTFILKGGKSA